ncbi:hypothetical protein PoB_002991300 [Plakobranchus ocellatus]|uniref:Uncharacterized protein n=1 Tax=Plakobranchus ocellatus TaxID=259542 RepID=A0AAV4A9H0_9GAST|nr:hypothetical protein PoB_002991300 [Plakobranchus ocellatus]
MFSSAMSDMQEWQPDWLRPSPTPTDTPDLWKSLRRGVLLLKHWDHFTVQALKSILELWVTFIFQWILDVTRRSPEARDFEIDECVNESRVFSRHGKNIVVL